MPNKMWIVNEISPDGGVKVTDPFKGIFDSADQAIDYALASIGWVLGDDMPLVDSALDDDSDIDFIEYQASPGLVLQVRQVVIGSVNLKMTVTQATVLYEKLDRLLKLCLPGVDIYLAEGGYLDVNKHPDHDDVFLTPDPGDVNELDAIHSMLRGHLKITTYNK